MSAFYLVLLLDKVGNFVTNASELKLSVYKWWHFISTCIWCFHLIAHTLSIGSWLYRLTSLFNNRSEVLLSSSWTCPQIWCHYLSHVKNTCLLRYNSSHELLGDSFINSSWLLYYRYIWSPLSVFGGVRAAHLYIILLFLFMLNFMLFSVRMFSWICLSTFVYPFVALTFYLKWFSELRCGVYALWLMDMTL